MRSIQTKLTVVILAIFIVALGALSGLNYWKARQIITETLTKDLTELSVNSAGDIGDWLEARKAEMTIMAVAPVIQSGNPDAILPFLANAAKENKFYDAVCFADQSGNFTNSANARGSIADREYFQLAVRGIVAVSDPVISKSTGHLIAPVAVPIKVGDKVTGVMYGTVTLDSLAKKIAAIKVGQTGYAYMLQKNGLIIAHPNKDFPMKLNAVTDISLPPGLRAVNERMVKGEAGLASYEYQGSEQLVAFAPISGTSWVLAITVPLAEVTGAVSALTTISLLTSVVVLIVAGIIISWYSRRMARPIRELEAAARRIAGGDISLVELASTSDDEIGRLGQSFQEMSANLRSLIQKIIGATEQVAAASQELTANAEQSAEAANQVSASITQTAQGTDRQSKTVDNVLSLVEQITNGAQQGATSTNHAVEITRRAVDAAGTGNAAVDTAIRQMNQIQVAVDDSAKVVVELGENSKEIGNIVETIANIAGQTNLLALNAAIEAARAGEQGRGFAVVAEEVRKLAEESEEAAKQIAALIGNIQAKTETAVSAMTQGTAEVTKGTEVVDKAGAAFRDIGNQVAEVADIAQRAANGQSELAATSGKVLSAVQEVDKVSREIAAQAQNISASVEEQSATMQEIASSSQSLAKLAADLQEAAAKFRL
jgi:methyl-accepting chemotaxis protein